VRVSSTSALPDAPLSALRSPDGLTDWKLFQRGPDGTAPIPLRVAYRASAAVRLETRLSESTSGATLPGFDFDDAPIDLEPAPSGAVSSSTIDDVPEGGNYELTIRLVDIESGAILGEESVSELAVGDVFLAAGQSNMSGYSAVLEPAEEPTPSVHLFGNDYVWKLAAEPMDAGTDQVDRVSEETPNHSLMLRFGKEVAAGIGVPVAIIPAPLGGSNLFSQWQRREDDPDNRGTLYGSAIHRVLRQGYAHPIRGVIWYQGESDVDNGAAAYLENLRTLVANFRSDLGRPDLFFGNCQLATYLQADLDTWIPLQDAQRLHAAEDALTIIVALIDQPRSDNIHLDVAGYKEAGRRLANAVLDDLYGVPRSLGPRIVDVRFGSSARDQIVIEYDKNVTGGTRTPFRVSDNGVPVTILGATPSGATMILQLQQPLSPTGGRVSYGYTLDPGPGLVVAEDGGGAALAFWEIPVQ
jgi:sialate O-acetylesterase